jgi:hypothetical protein
LPFRRRSSSEVLETPDDEEVVPATPARSRGYTQSKREQGRATPKRKEGGRRVEAPPANRREAIRRDREKQRERRAKQREQRAEIRAGMMAGKEEYLPARDKGPERSLVRDIVDARRNVASYFLPGAFIVIIGSSATMPATIRLGANLLWVVLALAVVVDSVLLTRRIKTLIRTRFPKATKPPRSHYFYAIMRSFQFRRLRLPQPKVKLGEAVKP